MKMYTEKELERLNHSQLCEILRENSIEFIEEESKAQLRAKILEHLNAEENVESTEESKVDEVSTESDGEDKKDEISKVIESVRREKTLANSGLSKLIAARRAKFSSDRVGSVEDAIAARRKKF